MRWGFVAAVLLASGSASSAPRIRVQVSAFRDVVDSKTGKVLRSTPATSATPGTTLRYVVSFENSGDDKAVNAVVEDPIPKGTVFIGNSATGEGAEILFSNDGGVTFAAPVKLSYELKLPNGKTERRVATPDTYTNIRWVLREVPPGAKGSVGFQVRVL